jgi:hypothetical protein
MVFLTALLMPGGLYQDLLIHLQLPVKNEDPFVFLKATMYQ